MLRLNQETRTLSGQSVTPYMVENGYIYCWDRSGKTTVKKLNDFGQTDLAPAMENMSSGAAISVTPVYRTRTPVVEVEVSRPTLETPTEVTTEINSEVETTMATIENPRTGVAVTANPDETEEAKVTYVHVAPAIDNYLSDGELQVGGVEVVTPEEAEGRNVFVPVIEDDDYI
jgi:hypothetical protein